jgi:xanthine dehydrogenase accessory factor
MLDRQVIFELADAVKNNRPLVLATVIGTRRSAPRHSGTKMLIFGDGATVGTVGGGEMESRVIDAAREVFDDRQPRVVEYALVDPTRGDPGICGGEVEIYLEPYMPQHTVYVIGCGHVGRAVIDLAHWVGYRTVAVDDRAEVLDEAALPNADVLVHGTLANLAEPVPEDASVVLVTRNTDLDTAILPEALATPARYIGVMGSTTRWRTVARRLEEAGFASTQLERVRSPIGIEMNAETLEELAVSIISEIVQVNRSAASDSEYP